MKRSFLCCALALGWAVPSTAQAGYIITDLGTLGGNSSTATGINNSGQVAGYSYTTGNRPFHAFLYDGSLHDLGTLGGNFSQATGINNSGQVVGYSNTANGRFDAFLYDNGSLIDLNSLLPAGSDFAYLTIAYAINDNGQIVGNGVTNGGQTHAFLLTPVPAPPSLILANIGIACLAGFAWRRDGRDGRRV